MLIASFASDHKIFPIPHDHSMVSRLDLLFILPLFFFISWQLSDELLVDEIHEPIYSW